MDRELLCVRGEDREIDALRAPRPSGHREHSDASSGVSAVCPMAERSTLSVNAAPFPSPSPPRRPICSFYLEGRCRFGEGCWFSHDTQAGAASDGEAVSDLDELDCAICFERPTMFGLLENCSHIFCFACINRWRTIEGKSTDQILSGTLSACPICRSSASFVCQSLVFYPAGQEKQFAIALMKHRLGSIDCKYFKPSQPNSRSCPWGSDCLYRHRKLDGTLHRLDYTRQQHLEWANRPRTMEEGFLLDLLTQAAAGRDVAELLRRTAGRRRGADSDLDDFLANLRQLGYAEGTLDEDDGWVDEDDMSFDEDHYDDDESDEDTPNLEFTSDTESPFAAPVQRHGGPVHESRPPASPAQTAGTAADRPQAVVTRQRAHERARQRSFAPSPPDRGVNRLGLNETIVEDVVSPSTEDLVDTGDSMVTSLYRLAMS